MVSSGIVSQILLEFLPGNSVTLHARDSKASFAGIPPDISPELLGLLLFLEGFLQKFFQRFIYEFLSLL